MTDDFTVYPAIDLRGGRVVRLRQGDPDREMEYETRPAVVARRWRAAGARWLHVVNLDGALGTSSAANVEALDAVLALGLRVQFGGGLRDFAAVQRTLERGVARVVLGTVAVEDPATVEAALAAFGPERVAVGVDAREGVVRIRGWQTEAPLRAEELVQRWAAMGGRWLVFTDVSRDGMGSGVNVAATASLAEATDLRVIASGGVATLDDVRRVRDVGLSGVIIGRALYEGQVHLEDALALSADFGF